MILLQGCPAPRGSASVPASVRGRVPAWDRVGPRRCPRQCPRQCGGRGLTWVRVGPRQCPRGCGRLGARVGPRESTWIRVSVRVSTGTGASRGSAWVRVSCRVGPRGSAWVRVGPRQCPRGCAIGARVRPRISASVSAQCPLSVRVSAGRRASAWDQCRASRGSAWVRVSARVGAGRGGPRGSAWVRISVRVSAGRKNRGADLTHTHFATTFCGKNIGPEFDTGTRQALCTATVPPKRL